MCKGKGGENIVLLGSGGGNPDRSRYAAEGAKYVQTDSSKTGRQGPLITGREPKRAEADKVR